MRIVFNNSALVFAKSVWSATGKLIKVSPTEATSVNLPNGANVYGRNLVDVTKLKFKKILNDAGNEVSDSSSYFDQFIPTFGGMTLRSNCKFSRIYLYDADKNMILRYGVSNASSFVVPSQQSGKEVVYIKIQTAVHTQAELDNMIVTRDEDVEPTTFEAFKSNANGEIYEPYSWVWADDLREITITAK